MKEIEVEKLDCSIKLLRQYVNETSIDPLISVLEALKKDPHNESLVEQFSKEFMKLGIVQGAVLTYAPYIIVLLSDDPFENKTLP